MTERVHSVPLGTFAIDEALCTACGVCVPVCPYGLLEMPEGHGPVALVDPDSCTSCSACRTVCPVGAISVSVGQPGT